MNHPNLRKVDFVVAPSSPHFVGDGFRVHNFIPSHPRLSMQAMDPFIMLDYNAPYYFPPTDRPRGVDVHPHKGFETVTIAYKGSVEHHDSSGGGGIISEGDVQWMTAGKGVLHKEFHETEWSSRGGDFQMVQLWVNLPSKDKGVAPSYQTISNKDLQFYDLEDQLGLVEIIAGEYKGVKGSATTFSPMNVYNLKLKAGAKLTLDFPAKDNTALLVLNGGIKINDETEVTNSHLAKMDNEGTEFTVSADQDSLVLVISGTPLNEPIASHGPFVMNTKEELVQAFQDFQDGKFGTLD